MKNKVTCRELAELLGVSERSAQRVIAREGVLPELEGSRRIYSISSFSPDLQKKLVTRCAVSSLPAKFVNRGPGFEHTLQEDVLADSRVVACSRVVQEALNPPPAWKSKRWKLAVARKHGIDISTLYGWIKRFGAGGHAALRHTKANKGKPKVWTQEALDFGCGLALKRPHRKMSEKAVFEGVLAEAAQRGWTTGGYRSFCSHLKKKLGSQLIAIRDGGKRALDNILPPILRDYSDLAPFEILVGDQHRFDFWVVDDETGAIFRPEGYFFQDLRTRLVYGLWLGKRYTGHSIGLALRLGCRLFGGFRSIYTDNGRPEESKYLAGVVDEMAALGFSVGEAVDVPIDFSDQDPEEAACLVAPAGNHRKAIVRNAKAKMIESWNRHFEALLRDKFKVPGHVKRLTASGEEQEVDSLEIKRLAQAGKLLKFSEFLLTVIKAADFYNRERPHRGLLREWKAKPRPTEVTPFQCLLACQQEGWRASWVSEDALNLLFLPKDTRSVDRGRIRFRTALADLYEHEALAALHGQKVTVRHDPLDPGWILVFSGSKFICQAKPVEYSSMVDTALAQRKIEQKARLRKQYLEEYHRLTSKVPDLTQYSALPSLESTAKEVRLSIEAERVAQEKLACEPADEDLAAEILANEEFERRSEEAIIIDAGRPTRSHQVFEYEVDRYQFLLDEMKQGAGLSEDDLAFKEKFESAMSEDAQDYWAIYREVHDIPAEAELPLQRTCR